MKEANKLMEVAARVDIEKILFALRKDIDNYFRNKEGKRIDFEAILNECSAILIQRSIITAGPDVTSFLANAGLVKLPYDES